MHITIFERVVFYVIGRVLDAWSACRVRTHNYTYTQAGSKHQRARTFRTSDKPMLLQHRYKLCLSSAEVLDIPRCVCLVWLSARARCLLSRSRVMRHLWHMLRVPPLRLIRYVRLYIFFFCTIISCAVFCCGPASIAAAVVVKSVQEVNWFGWKRSSNTPCVCVRERAFVCVSRTYTRMCRRRRYRYYIKDWDWCWCKQLQS